MRGEEEVDREMSRQFWIRLELEVGSTSNQGKQFG